MQYFLAKTDPDTYPIDKFEQDKKTCWDGVRNAHILCGAVRVLDQQRVEPDVAGSGVGIALHRRELYCDRAGFRCNDQLSADHFGGPHDASIAECQAELGLLRRHGNDSGRSLRLGTGRKRGGHSGEQHKNACLVHVSERLAVRPRQRGSRKWCPWWCLAGTDPGCCGRWR